MQFSKLMASALCAVLVFSTMPVSAADFSTARPTMVGSIANIGSVDLRGVRMASEGTLFAGDLIRTHASGYAKIVLSDGDKLQMDKSTEMSVRGGSPVQLVMNAGNIGFTGAGSKPLNILAAGYEVVTDSGSGNVAFVNPETLGIRAIKGKLTVRNSRNNETFVLTQGQERLLNAKSGQSIAEWTSAVPSSIPQGTSTRTTTTTTTSSGIGMDAGAWLAVIAGAGLGVIAITALIYGKQARDDVRGLQGSVNTLQGSLNNITSQQAAQQAALAAALRALQNANQVQSTANQAQNNAAAIANTASATRAAIASTSNLTPAQRAQLEGMAAAIQTQTNAASAVIAGLLAQIAALQAQFASGNATAAQVAQLNALNAQLTTQLGILNNLLGQLGNLLNQARNMGVNTPPPPGVNTIPPAPTASASVPF